MTEKELTDLEKAYSNVNEQLKALRKVNAELERKIEILEAHIYHQKRLRSIVKNLVFSIDQIITLHLTKGTKKPHYYPNMHITEQDKLVPSIFLDLLNEADKKSFEGKPGLVTNISTGLAGFILTLYMTIRKISFKVAKVLIRTLRKSRAGENNEKI